MATSTSNPMLENADGAGSSSSSSLASSADSGSVENSLGMPTPPPSPVVNGHDTSSPAKHGKMGPKFKLLHEGDAVLCRLNHTRTIVSKIMNSKYLRRWESHRLILGDSDLRSLTVSAHNSQVKVL